MSVNDTDDVVVAAVCGLIVGICASDDPTPYHNSILTGEMYYRELMTTNNIERFRNAARMDKASFLELLDFLARRGLRDSRRVKAGPKLFIFVAALIGFSNRHIAERWQYSMSTISGVIQEVLGMFMSARADFFVPPTLDKVPPQISISPKYNTFFQHCIGALDGSHIPAVVTDPTNWRNRKGLITQNVLVVCNFDMTISFCLTGWEGSAHDGRVLADALTKGLVTAPGKYYLGDAGYALSEHCLTPYRGVRYHLKEWRQARELNADLTPQTKEELFNLRHSSLRNVIERTFGVIKKRFPLLQCMNSYRLETQTGLVQCAFMIHNFIRARNLNYEDDFYRMFDDEDVDNAAVLAAELHQSPAPRSSGSVSDQALNAWRDGIAQAMWVNYCAYYGLTGI